MIAPDFRDFIDCFARRVPEFDDSSHFAVSQDDAEVCRRVADLARRLNDQSPIPGTNPGEMASLIGRTLTTVAGTECTVPGKVNHYRKYLILRQPEVVSALALLIRRRSLKEERHLVPVEVWGDPEVQFALRKRRRLGSFKKRLRWIRDQAEARGFKKGSTDVLTGLQMRRIFDQRFTEAVLRMMESSGAISLIFFDVDDFRKFNNEYGYAGGDDVLRAVGAHLSTACRIEERRQVERDKKDRRKDPKRNDVVFLPAHVPFRVGGEEFKVLLLPGVDEATLERIMEERIRKGVAQLRVPLSVSYGSHTEGEVLTTTVSVAGMTLNPHSHFGETRKCQWNEMKDVDRDSYTQEVITFMNGHVNRGLKQSKAAGKNVCTRVKLEKSS